MKNTFHVRSSVYARKACLHVHSCFLIQVGCCVPGLLVYETTVHLRCSVHATNACLHVQSCCLFVFLRKTMFFQVDCCAPGLLVYEKHISCGLHRSRDEGMFTCTFVIFDSSWLLCASLVCV